MRETSDLPTAPGAAELPGEGKVLPITRWGTDVMHRPARTVTSYDDDLARLVRDMVATMYAADGVGLAACQVGVDLAVFVFDCPDDDGLIHRGVVCNPELEVHEGRERRLDEDDEGCLSFPGGFVPLARPDWARVTGTDHTGAEVSYAGDGLLARCLQHETDHTRGTVFGDRLPAKRMKKLRKQVESESEAYPQGWPAPA